MTFNATRNRTLQTLPQGTPHYTLNLAKRNSALIYCTVPLNKRHSINMDRYNEHRTHYKEQKLEILYTVTTREKRDLERKS